MRWRLQPCIWSFLLALGIEVGSSSALPSVCVSAPNDPRLSTWTLIIILRVWGY